MSGSGQPEIPTKLSDLFGCMDTEFIPGCFWLERARVELGSQESAGALLPTARFP